MMHSLYKFVAEIAICFAAICLGSSIRASDFEQTDKESWLCAGSCSGASGVDYAKRNVAKAARHNEQFFYPTLTGFLLPSLFCIQKMWKKNWKNFEKIFVCTLQVVLVCFEEDFMRIRGNGNQDLPTVSGLSQQTINACDWWVSFQIWYEISDIPRILVSEELASFFSCECQLELVLCFLLQFFSG